MNVNEVRWTLDRYKYESKGTYAIHRCHVPDLERWSFTTKKCKVREPVFKFKHKVINEEKANELLNDNF